ncbi:uncharacterized protein LOC132800001 [Ziziphus jujuba]|uniref:Uncharacterized protein LOC132800001 n=1 Tax=Ziziphus jujuba TaxID=326968 RepID=A0ABM3ZWJ0_ZIZJJ|nr:uncharacterized protein LOC132800001 [Ziziphus jujuba]
MKVDFDSCRDSVNPISTKRDDEKHQVERKQDGNKPLFVYKFTGKPPALSREPNSPLVLPVRDGFSSVLSKCPNPTFHFQETRRNGRSRKAVHSSDILALIRRTKRT